MSLFNELKRRNVFRVGLAYLVSAWAIAQVADLVLDNIDAPPWVMQAILLVLGLGFIIALIIAWAYELTPEGLKKDSEVTRDESIVNHTAKKLDYITIIAALGVLGMFIYQQMNPTTQVVNSNPTSAVANPKSVIPAQAGTQSDVSDSNPNLTGKDKQGLTLGVAVLPFANLSEDPNNAFFAGGVHEDVLTQLSYIKKLHIISRTSMMKIAKRDMEVREIGKHLGVSHVLEGSVRRSGDQVRVTVQLIDASTDEHVWADNFDRKLDDIFAIQSEIAEKIAAQLKTELTPDEIQQIEKIPTTSNEAYDLYVKARNLSRVWRGADTFKDMLSLLEQAIQLDPNFIKAQVLLVEVYGRLVWTGADPTGEYEIKAKETLDHILKKQPDSIEAISAQGQYLYTVESNYTASLVEFNKVLLVQPNNAVLLLRIASCYKRLGQFSQGLPIIKKAALLDPEHELIAGELVLQLMGSGLTEQAYLTSKLNLIKFPNSNALTFHGAMLELTLYGNVNEYRRLMEKVSAQVRYRESSVYIFMTTTTENINETINKIEEINPSKESVLALDKNRLISQLYNLVGNEPQSQQRAREALDLFDNDDGTIKDSIAYSEKGFYANMTLVACLADDRKAFTRFESLMQSHKAYELDEGEIAYSMALAECGETEKSWDIFSKMYNNNTSGMFTPWTLKLHPLFEKYYSELPEYQKLISGLEDTK